MEKRISFRPVEDADVPLLHRWRNEPHVMRWWYEDDGSDPTLDVVAKSYGPDPNEPDYPPYRDALQEEGVGMDLFIGEPAFVNRGVGTAVIREFLDQVVFADPTVTTCVVDPEVANTASIRAFEKAGFVRVREVSVPGEPGPALLMRATRAR